VRGTASITDPEIGTLSVSNRVDYFNSILQRVAAVHLRPLQSVLHGWFMFFAIFYGFCRAMLCKRGLCCHAVSVWPSVCVSATFVNSVKTNKHNIFKNVSPSSSQTILVFPHQTTWQYSDDCQKAEVRPYYADFAWQPSLASCWQANRVQTMFARVQMSTPDGTTIPGIDVRPAVGRHT